MLARNGSARIAGIAIATVAWMAITSAPSHADPRDGGESTNAGRLAWIGCWVHRAETDQPSPEPNPKAQRLCVESGNAPASLVLRAMAGDEVVAEQLLIVDGSKQQVSQDGCDGWKRSSLSADQHRLYLEAETTCEDGNQIRLSGASLIVSAGHWVDISVTRVGAERALVVRHYLRVSDEPTKEEADGQLVPTLHLPGTLPDTKSVARVVAAAPLEVDDVVEALDHLDSSVVEAMIVESETRFEMDAALLLRLDRAGVPGQIIDLMVAVSYPAEFAIDDEPVTTYVVLDNRSWGVWPYGYGYWYWYGYDHDHGNRPPRNAGRAIGGAGYTRVRPLKLPPVGAGSPTSGSQGSGGGVSSGSAPGSGHSASDSGYRGGGSGSVRKAVPR